MYCFINYSQENIEILLLNKTHLLINTSQNGIE